jgi:hypothetical protein
MLLSGQSSRSKGLSNNRTLNIEGDGCTGAIIFSPYPERVYARTQNCQFNTIYNTL